VTTSEVIAPAEPASARVRHAGAAVLSAIQLAVVGYFALTPLVTSRSDDGYGPLALAGSFLTVLIGPLTALLAIVGGAQVASRWADRRSGSVLALGAGTALCLVVFVFSLTPAGRGLTATLTR
jgi:hypothetical protein